MERVETTSGAHPAGSETAHAQRRRTLQTRERRLLRMVAGVHGFSAVASVVWGIALTALGGIGWLYATILFVLAVVCGWLFVAVWRNRTPRMIWLFLPSTLLVLVYGGLGLFTSSVLWLNLAVHVAIPFLRITQRQCEALEAPHTG
jgi:hypothetical protein